MTVESPFEIFELPDGASRTLDVVDYEEGELTIHPANRPARVVRAMRLHLRAGTKPTPPSYYDITASTIQPTLRALLAPPGGSMPRRIVLTKYGVGADGRYTAQDLGALSGA